MKLKISLGNIGKAIKQVEEYKNSLAQKEHEFLQRLAEIGITEAETRFREAKYPGTNDIKVEEPIWLDENKIAVRANGNSITFIEFGAGVYFPEMHEKAYDFGFERGEYGKKQGKNSYWLYRGEQGKGNLATESKAVSGLMITHGNPPNRCMWEADKKIRSEILNIAREVFGK